jgi:hypothetical protein
MRHYDVAGGTRDGSGHSNIASLHVSDWTTLRTCRFLCAQAFVAAALTLNARQAPFLRTHSPVLYLHILSSKRPYQHAAAAAQRLVSLDRPSNHTLCTSTRWKVRNESGHSEEALLHVSGWCRSRTLLGYYPISTWLVLRPRLVNSATVLGGAPLMCSKRFAEAFHDVCTSDWRAVSRRNFLSGIAASEFSSLIIAYIAPLSRYPGAPDPV